MVKMITKPTNWVDKRLKSDYISTMKRITLAMLLAMSATSAVAEIKYNPEGYGVSEDLTGTPAEIYADVLNGRNNPANFNARRANCPAVEEAWVASFDWVADHMGRPRLGTITDMADYHATLNEANLLEDPVVNAQILAAKEAYGLWTAAECYQ